MKPPRPVPACSKRCVFVFVIVFVFWFGFVCVLSCPSCLYEYSPAPLMCTLLPFVSVLSRPSFSRLLSWCLRHQLTGLCAHVHARTNSRTADEGQEVDVLDAVWPRYQAAHVLLELLELLGLLERTIQAQTCLHACMYVCMYVHVLLESDLRGLCKSMQDCR